MQKNYNKTIQQAFSINSNEQINTIEPYEIFNIFETTAILKGQIFVRNITSFYQDPNGQVTLHITVYRCGMPNLTKDILVNQETAKKDLDKWLIITTNIRKVTVEFIPVEGSPLPNDTLGFIYRYDLTEQYSIFN